MKPTVNPVSISADPPASPGRSPGDQLVFRIGFRGGVVVLAARGHADAFTLPLWREQVAETAEVAAGGEGALIIDATRLEFLSLRTLAATAEDAYRYRGEGVEVCLVSPDPELARLAAGDTRTAALPVHYTVVSALTAIQLRRRTTPFTGRRPYRAPEIAPTVPRSGQNGRVRVRAESPAVGAWEFPDAVVPTTVPRTDRG
ncbi:STAS domain-containing protein [Nocardia sp. NPDC050193]